MGHFLRSGSHLYKQATFRKTVVGLTKIGQILKKWVTLEKMGYVFKKWFTLEKLVTFNKIDHIVLTFRTISQTLRKQLDKWVTLLKISYVQKNELHSIKWVGNELNYSKRVTFEEMGHTCRNRPRLKKKVGLIEMGQI